jgi:hypothetical protein
MAEGHIPELQFSTGLVEKTVAYAACLGFDTPARDRTLKDGGWPAKRAGNLSHELFVPFGLGPPQGMIDMQNCELSSGLSSQFRQQVEQHHRVGSARNSDTEPIRNRQRAITLEKSIKPF